MSDFTEEELTARAEARAKAAFDSLSNEYNQDASSTDEDFKTGGLHHSVGRGVGGRR
jgi:hypothetical protein